MMPRAYPQEFANCQKRFGLANSIMYQQFVIANCCPAAAKTQAYQLATSQKSWGIYLQKARDVTPLVHVVQHSHRNSNGVCSVILQLRPKFARIAPLCKDSKIH